MGACEQASAPGFFLGHILAHRRRRNPVAWLTLATWESGDWFLPFPKLLDLCERKASRIECCVYLHKYYVVASYM